MMHFRRLIFVNIEHTWRGDLELRLVSPGGENVVVHSFSQGDSQDDVVETFNATELMAGQPCRGRWTLKVIDRAGRDTGTLKSWSLGINQQAPQE
jgi:subtilisin-like proprotein convertase family protein